MAATGVVSPPESDRAQPASHPPGGLVRAAIVASLLVVAFALAWLRFAGPEPLGGDASPERFSAARALDQLRVVLGDEAPHPVGSPANGAVRQRIVARLRALGYEPEIQRDAGCGGGGRCRSLQNIVATVPGGPGAVLLVAHYDSVPAGPGAADDGAAVGAMLEVARVLATAPAPRNTIVLLFDDGEEAGLLGAELFMAGHPLAGQVQVVINLEARGTSGPSLMFETAGPTAELARHLAAGLDRPISSSLFSAVYEQLPNDTDLTVFRRYGLAGYNFAFIDDARHYHTAQDDLAHVSAASVQHHGDNALALLRVLAEADLGTLRQGGDAVWFDLLGWFVVTWPLSWSLPLAVVALALLGGAMVGAKRRQPRFLSAWLACLGASLGALLVAGLLSALVVWLLASVGVLVQFGEGSAPLLVGVPLVVSLAVVALTARAGVVQRARPVDRYGAVWSLWALLMVGVAVGIPEGSYLFILPGMVAGLVALATGGRVSQGSWAELLTSLLPVLVAALLWLTVVLALVAALGLAGQVAIGLAVALTVTTALPALGPGRTAAVPPPG